jgi:integrase
MGEEIAQRGQVMDTQTAVATVTTRKPRKEKLPRGIRRRGKSLCAYLTHLDGSFEIRTVKGLVTPKFAAQQREIWQREITEGRYLKPKPRTDLVLFSDICDKGLQYFKDYTRAWDATEGRIARFKEWWPSRAADSITTAEIDAVLLSNLAPRGLKWTKTTSNEYRTTLARLYALAIGRKELTENPAAAAKRHKLENARIRELSLTEEDALRAAIRKLHPMKECEFDLGLHTMARHSNLYGQHNAKRTPMDALDWADVDLNFRVVTFKRSKSGKPYRVPLNDTALAAFKVLRERGDGTGAVIRKPRPIKTRADGRELFSSRRWFENCLAEAKIDDFSWHDFRHTSASRLRAAGVAVEDIRVLLGHGAKSITERYAHASLDVLRVAVAKLDRKTDTQNQTDTKTDTANVLQFKTA